MEIQCSSLKNETVIFIIPHTINTITIHVFKIISSIIPNYFQNSFNRDRVNLVVSKKLKPFMCFAYETIYHTKAKFTKLNFKNIKNFRIEWREV